MHLSLIAIKFISALLLPLPIAVLLLIAAVCFKRFRITFCALAIALLFLAGLSPVAEMVIAPLENPYSPITQLPSDVDTILVLGAGVRSNTHLPANTQLNSAALSRLVEGIRLYQLIAKTNKNAHIILSGGHVFLSSDKSGVIENTAHILGVKQADITIQRGYNNTQEEAAHLKETFKNKPFLLVTSANHMTRSLYFFRKSGMKPIPAPTQFLSGGRDEGFSRAWMPRASNLVRIDIALHEYLGMLWGRLKT